MSQRSQLQALKQEILQLIAEYKRLKVHESGGNTIDVTLSKTVGDVLYFTGDRPVDPGSNKHKFIQAVVEHIQGQTSTTFQESEYTFTCDKCEARWTPWITATKKQIKVTKDAVTADVYELQYEGKYVIQSCTCTPTPLQVHTTQQVKL